MKMRGELFAGIVAVAAVFAIACVAPAFAQNPPSQKHLDVAAAKAERKAVIGQNMQLTPSEAKAFWPLYDKYEAAQDKVDERHANEIKEYAASYHHFTNANARRKLNEVLAVEQDRLDVQKEFVPKFRKALSDIKTTRFFQIDNKLHALIQCQIAQMVPLVGTAKTAQEGGGAH